MNSVPFSSDPRGSSGLKLTRRDFLYALGATAALHEVYPQLTAPATARRGTKAISGSWFEFQHVPTFEGVDWDPMCVRFTCEQWDAKIKEIAEVGIEYLVLMSTALYFRSFFPTKIYPQWRMNCPDLMETVLSAADKYGVKMFVGGGFYGELESSSGISDPEAAKKRLQAIEEIANLYGHHRSFHGWYWPDEAFINRHFSGEFIQYVNSSSRLARQLTPRARILIAPYGTRVAVPDDEYVRQLTSLDVDIIAYQDEVGVRKSSVKETPAFFEGLRKAHDRAQRAAIWADVEIFQCEGAVYKSALLPGPFERILKQLEAVSLWVDKILVYQYQGMMNKPGSTAFCGSPDSARLYTEYASWLRSRAEAQT